MSKDDFILVFSQLVFGQLCHYKLEIIFPWNFEDIALRLLAPSTAFENCKAILILEPTYEISFFSLEIDRIFSLQESLKLPSSIPNNPCLKESIY